MALRVRQRSPVYSGLLPAPQGPRAQTDPLIVVFINSFTTLFLLHSAVSCSRASLGPKAKYWWHIPSSQEKDLKKTPGQDWKWAHELWEESLGCLECGLEGRPQATS